MKPQCSPVARRYAITIDGHLSPGRLARIDGLAALPQPDGSTRLLTGDLDQSALYGLLDTLSGLGLDLISLQPVTQASPC